MVVKETCVLPTPLSPNINCLWPLPTGTTASTIAQPVNKGSQTGHLALIPGALYSTGLIFGLWIGKSFQKNGLFVEELFLKTTSLTGFIVVPKYEDPTSIVKGTNVRIILSCAMI